MTTTPDWRATSMEIRLAQIELMRLAPFRDVGLIPHPAATEERVAQAEVRVGRLLPPSYRAFLARHDGWPRFFEGADLLGSSQLGDPKYDRLTRSTLTALDPPRSAHHSTLIPFGVDSQATTIFAFDASTADADGEMPVLAWVNEIGLRAPNFPEFLELVLQFCQAELAAQRAHTSEVARHALEGPRHALEGPRHALEGPRHAAKSA